MSANKPISERDYDFSDAVLEQFSDIVAANVTRDMAELAPRGITAATVTALDALRAALVNAPTDIEERSLVGEAAEAKDAARDAALVDARRLRTAAQNVFGEDSAKYRRFGFTGMDRLSDAELSSALYRFHRVGTAVQPQLAAEGIDAPFLAEFLTAIAAYDDALEVVGIAEETRDAQTEDRVEKGNTLYKEIVRICNIGKDVFATISEATYNDYVIENYVGGDKAFPATSLEIRGTVTVEGSTTPVVSAIVMLEDVETSLVKIKASVEDIPATTTDDQGRYKFLFTDLPAGASGVLKLIIDAPGFQHYEQIFPVTVGEVIVMDVPLALGMRKVA